MSANRSPKAALMAVLRTMRPGPNYWTTDHIDMYDMGLQDLPSDACLVVTKAILAAFDERPSCKQIMTIYADLNSRQEAMDLAEVLAKLADLARKYGVNGAHHPVFPDKWPLIRGVGAPPEIALMPPAVGRTIAAFGGWPEFALGFSWSDAADRAQFRDLFKAATGTASEAALRSLRRELQASRPVHIDSPKQPEAPDYSETNIAPSREEAGAILGKLGQFARAL